MGKIGQMRFQLVLLGIAIASFALFSALYRWDNKYSVMCPASGGVMRVDMEQYERRPLLHLVQGWEFYQYQFLSPTDISGHIPDTILSIGQYGGFELGDRTASPHGAGTYRLTIFLDEFPRDYALELTEIYSVYKIWVNGVLKNTAGFTAEEGYAPQTSHSMITFTAAGSVEIVVAVLDETHFYSGMVYPPAFGSIEQILRLLSLRLLIRAAVCGVALVVALLSLFFGYRDRRSAFPILSLLCLSFIAYTSYPLVHMLGLRGEIWYDLENIGYYAMLFCVIWLAGMLCRPLPALRGGMMAAALAICAAIPVYRHLLMRGAQDMCLFSHALLIWKWGGAIYLLATVGYAVFFRRQRAGGLLAGICVTVAALVADRVYPWFEPIVTGWFGEVAAFVFILIIMGVLSLDALHTYRESRALEAAAKVDALRLEALRLQDTLQREYVTQTRKLAHDTRSSFLAMRHYLDNGQMKEMSAYIDGLLGSMDARPHTHITAHPLLRAILSDFLSRAETTEISTTCRVEVPARLSIDDAELVRLCGNILDNALEACRYVPPENRFIRLHVLYGTGVLELQCENSFDGVIHTNGERFRSRKPDGRNHGFGTRIIREVAYKFGSQATFSWDETTFRVVVRLHLDF